MRTLRFWYKKFNPKYLRLLQDNMTEDDLNNMENDNNKKKCHIIPITEEEKEAEKEAEEKELGQNKLLELPIYDDDN